MVGMGYLLTDHTILRPFRVLVIDSIIYPVIAFCGAWMGIDWWMSGGSEAKAIGAVVIILVGTLGIYRAWYGWNVYVVHKRETA